MGEMWFFLANIVRKHSLLEWPRQEENGPSIEQTKDCTKYRIINTKIELNMWVNCMLFFFFFWYSKAWMTSIHPPCLYPIGFFALCCLVIMGTLHCLWGKWFHLSNLPCGNQRGQVFNVENVLISENQKADSVWNDTLSLNHRVCENSS